MRAWAYEYGVMWVMDLDNVVAPVAAQITATFGEVHAEAAPALAQAMGLPDSQLVLRRLMTGRRCFVAWVEEQLAAYGWVSQATECIGEHEREFQLAAGEAYIWDCATRLPYRRQRLYSALLSHIIAQLRTEQVWRIWIGTSVSNQPSLLAFAKVGFQPVLQLIHLRLLNVSVEWMAGYTSASTEWVLAARRALTAPHERWWGNISIGWTPSTPLSACTQLEG